MPVTRLFNSVSGQHLYTIDANEAATLPHNRDWHNEGVTFQAVPVSNGACDPSTTTVYRLYNKVSGMHFLTADSYENYFWTSGANRTDWVSEGVAFCVFGSQVNGSTAVYRLYNYKSGEHLLTTDSYEATNLNGRSNWVIESVDRGGIAFYAMP
jgi:hypothetical protein